MLSRTTQRTLIVFAALIATTFVIAAAGAQLSAQHAKSGCELTGPISCSGVTATSDGVTLHLDAKQQVSAVRVQLSGGCTTPANSVFLKSASGAFDAHFACTSDASHADITVLYGTTRQVESGSYIQ